MLLTTDFTGIHKIAQDNNTASILSDYIARYEKKYLIDLFGHTLYELFIADLVGGVPQTARFVTIYEELYYSESGVDAPFYPLNGQYSRSDRSLYDTAFTAREEPSFSYGIREMLKGFIYFEFVSEYGIIASQTGVVQNLNENSTNAGGNQVLAKAEDRYNDAVNSYKVIRNYMKANPSTYPEYDGIEKDSVYFGAI